MSKRIAPNNFYHHHAHGHCDAHSGADLLVFEAG